MSHSSILVFGGSGKVSRRLTPLLVSAGYTLYSIIRNPDQSDSIRSLGAKPIVQSIETSSVTDLVATIKSVAPKAIVWSAGAGGGDPSRTDAVDRKGAIKGMDAAAEAGVKRFVIVSALDVRDRSRPAPDWYNENDLKTSERVWGAIKPYMEAKFDADRSLVEENSRRGLDYTIVRPGRLLDEDGVSKVDAGKVHLGKGVSREDVARVVVECLKTEGTIGMAFDVVGGDIEVADAVSKVVEKKEDCFERYH